MRERWVLTDYFERAMDLAECVQIEDGSFTCHITGWSWGGVKIRGGTCEECRTRLRAHLEETARQVLRQGRDLPLLTDDDPAPREEPPRIGLVDALRRIFPRTDPEGRFVSAYDFARAAGTSGGALLYAAVFCPQFVEIDGMVFLDRDRDEDEYAAEIRDFRARVHGDLREVQWVHNLVEILYLFGQHEPRAGEDEERLLAELVAEAWRGRLLLMYPNRRFAVEVVDPELVHYVDATALTFYEIP